MCSPALCLQSSEYCVSGTASGATEHQPCVNMQLPHRLLTSTLCFYLRFSPDVLALRVMLLLLAKMPQPTTAPRTKLRRHYSHLSLRELAGRCLVSDEVFTGATQHPARRRPHHRSCRPDTTLTSSSLQSQHTHLNPAKTAHGKLAQARQLTCPASS